MTVVTRKVDYIEIQMLMHCFVIPISWALSHGVYLTQEDTRRAKCTEPIASAEPIAPMAKEGETERNSDRGEADGVHHQIKSGPLSETDGSRSSRRAPGNGKVLGRDTAGALTDSGDPPGGEGGDGTRSETSGGRDVEGFLEPITQIAEQ